MTTLHFASPWLLLLLLVPLGLALLPFLPRTRRQPAALQYSDLRLAAQLGPSLRERGRVILPVLRLIGLALLIIALARPQAGSAREIITGEGIDIVIVLDISGSMAALDFDPNRLGAAKRVINDFIQQRKYDRVGFVIFASEAFSQVPPTLDYKVVQRVLDETQVSWDIGLDSGTAIGLGLANGANMLRDSKADSRVIVLLTDGANNSGQVDPITAAQIAKALDIRVYTIGAARPGPAALPFPDGRVEYRDSEIDEETLRQIADITGGLYFRAEDGEGLQEIYDTINELERSQVEVRTFTRYRELAVWFILPAALILALEILLRRTLFRTIP
ncbi:MAG: aerotolerance regulator BatA [Anaerolineae bacterium]|nr:VWA domain-containing protein [Anaerolineales bacterium]MCQ3974071.1 aerotolerance regulator BatA [Anaerolineae bacterium]